jgi:hypothetical protein
MPARFLNISGNGQARFSNVSNSGRAVFGEVTSTETTTTTTTIPPNTFDIYAMITDSCSNIDNPRTVRTTNNDTDLATALANGAALYRMPQNVLLTGFSFARMQSGGNTYSINSTTGVVLSVSSTC